MKPQDVYDLGVREVARIEAEMRSILDANGFQADHRRRAGALGKSHVSISPTMIRAGPKHSRNTPASSRRPPSVRSNYSAHPKASSKCGVSRNSRKPPQPERTITGLPWMERGPAFSTPTFAT